MKKLKNIFIPILAALLLVLVSSCSEDDEKFIVSDTEPVVLGDLTITDIVLDPVNTNNPAVTFNWTEADYGQQVPVTYQIEVASDEMFSNSATAATVNSGNTVTLSASEVNVAAGNVGLPPFAWNMLYARVTSSVGTENGLPVASNSISFNVFPYFNYTFKDYYLVGNGVAPGWSNDNNNPPLFRDGNNPNIYYYTGYFTNSDGDFGNGRFKILETRGSWQPQWGVSDDEGDDVLKTSGSIAGNPETQDGDPGRFGVAADGYYQFSINFSSKTYTMAAYDASGATDFTSIEIQGSAATTTAMTQSTFDSHIWYLSSVRLTQGDLQFKTNSGSVWGGTTEFSGQATANGGNIPVIVEDDYEVWFNDLDGRYILIPLNL
ncbi:SusE domain-containing protein [Algibacter sp. 2305UL17-15]|uniref:SusE domain-containing protein n=1 Tax=Algibacter sp. 2305UL17-15 TaxID=3231268 RepID=UPI00345B12D8